MSLLDNLKGLGNNPPGLGRSSSFNPFKFLGIGESMLNYSDGVRIKDYTFFGILTSERFILVDNSPKGKGTIAKEMPSDLIQKADLEHEGATPILILHVLIEGQVRSMRLLFTGLIEDPDDEARAWYTSINGHPPETAKEKKVDSVQNVEQVYTEEYTEEDVAHTTPYSLQADAEQYTQVTEVAVEYEEERREIRDIPEIRDTPTVKPKPKQQYFVSDGIIDAEEEEERLVAAKIALPEQKQAQPVAPPSETVQTPAASHASAQPPSHISIQIKKQGVDPRRATSIHLQKPRLTPLGRGVVEPHLPIASREGTSSIAFCLMCGTSIPAKSRFCRICGERQ
jgi:hypothetical protein